MKFTTPEGYEVEVDARLGFTVHNQDGTSEQLVHLGKPRILNPPPPGPGGPGEPLPEPKAG